MRSIIELFCENSLTAKSRKLFSQKSSIMTQKNFYTFFYKQPAYKQLALET